MINVDEIKEKILQTLEQKGPSLPVTLASAVQLSPIFTSAILSELLNIQKVKISSLKIGSSPLYFLPGQEIMLEDFLDHMGGVNKTAYNKLKENRVLLDEVQDPAIRVALRSIKDFAVPIKFKDKLYWKYFKIRNEEVQNILTNISGTEEKVEMKGKIGNFEQERVEPKSETKIESKEEHEERPLLELKKPKLKIKKQNEFFEEVKDFLLKKDIEFVKEISIDRKEIVGKIRINSDFGKLVFLLIAKDKKKPQQADIMMAYQKSIEEKMPCYLLTFEEMSKKTKEFLEDYKNLVKVGQIV